MSAAAVFAVALPRHARAAEAPLEVRVEYSAAAGCPTEPYFIAEIEARTLHTHFGAETRPDIEIRANLRQALDQRGYRGTVVFVRGGRESAREVDATSCQELAEALAVVVAVAIDPEQVGRHPARSGDAASRPPMLPAPANARSQRWLAGTSLGGGVTSAVAPWPAWYVDLALELRRSGSAPALHAGFSFAEKSNYETEEGRSSFRWLGARVEACPTVLSLTGSFAIEPWLGFEAGAIGTTGRTTHGSASRWTGWAAPDANLRFRWTAHQQLSLSLVAGAAVPLIRHSFFLVNPERTAFQPPAIGLRSGIEATLHFQ